MEKSSKNLMALIAKVTRIAALHACCEIVNLRTLIKLPMPLLEHCKSFFFHVKKIQHEIREFFFRIIQRCVVSDQQTTVFTTLCEIQSRFSVVQYFFLHVFK